MPDTIFKTWPTAIKADEPSTRRMTFTISTGSVDRDRDTVNPKGWMLDNFRKNPIILFAHDYHALPVAKAVHISKTDEALIATAEFPPIGTYPFADQVHDMLKAGFLNATSVGFRATKDPIFNDERKGLDFSEQELMEFSIVPIPSNPDALIQQRDGGAAGAVTRQWRDLIVDKLFGPLAEKAPSDLAGVHRKAMDAYANAHHAVSIMESMLAGPEAAEGKAISGTHKAQMQEAHGAVQRARDHARAAAEGCAQGAMEHMAQPEQTKETTPPRPTDAELILELLDEPTAEGVTADDVRAALAAVAPELAQIAAQATRETVNQMLGRID